MRSVLRIAVIAAEMLAFALVLALAEAKLASWERKQQRTEEP